MVVWQGEAAIRGVCGVQRGPKAPGASGLLSHDDLVALEQSILTDPQAGDLVPGTGGLRKIRLGQRAVGRGKRGGLRVYYLDLPRRAVTHLLAIFGKREKTDLSPAERRQVAALVKELKEEEKP